MCRVHEEVKDEDAVPFFPVLRVAELRRFSSLFFLDGGRSGRLWRLGWVVTVEVVAVVLGVTMMMIDAAVFSEVELAKPVVRRKCKGVGEEEMLDVIRMLLVEKRS